MQSTSFIPPTIVQPKHSGYYPSKNTSSAKEQQLYKLIFFKYKYSLGFFQINIDKDSTNKYIYIYAFKSDAADDHLSRMNSNGAVIQNILPRVIQPIAQKKSHFSKHKSQFYKENQKIKNGGSASGKDFAIEPVRD